MQHWNSIQNSFNVSKNHRTFVPKMLVPKLTFYVPKWTVPIFRILTCTCT